MSVGIEFSVDINAGNQNQINGGGRFTLVKSRCPALASATLIPPGSSDAGNVVERMLPIGSKVEFLVESSTGADAGIRYRLPNGSTFMENDCRRASSESSGTLGWTLVGLIGAGALYYLLTKKK